MRNERLLGIVFLRLGRPLVKNRGYKGPAFEIKRLIEFFCRRKMAKKNKNEKKLRVSRAYELKWRTRVASGLLFVLLNTAYSTRI